MNWIGLDVSCEQNSFHYKMVFNVVDISAEEFFC